MKKAVLYLLPILFLGLCVLVMTGGRYLKAPRGEADNVAMHMRVLREDVLAERWEHALADTEGLERAWMLVIPRVQFSSERNEIERISINIARIRGSVLARDRGGALAELGEADRHFSELD